MPKRPLRPSTIIAGLALAALAACSASISPSLQDDACALKDDRPSWFRNLSRTEQRWGVPPHVILAVIYHESKFVADARTPRVYRLGFIPWGRRSSAYGYAQALDGTWDWYKNETGKRFARRDKFRDAADFIGWYMHRSHVQLGLSKSDAYNQYLAYHQGHTGYAEGRYRQLRWLRNVARGVETRADLYRRQLRRCN